MVCSMIQTNSDVRLRGKVNPSLSRLGFLEAIREASKRAKSKAEKEELGEVVKKLRLEWKEASESRAAS